MSRDNGFDLAHVLDPQHFADITGVAFRGLTISENGTGYNIVFRGTELTGEPVYAMTHSPYPLDGVKNLLAALADRSGKNLWRGDRFAKP